MKSEPSVTKEDLFVALMKNDGNRTAAGKDLRITVRTVRKWMNKYDLFKYFPKKCGGKRR